MYLAAAALILQFSLLFPVQAPAKTSTPAVVSKSADSTTAKSADRYAGTQTANGEVLSANASMATVAYAPGLLNPEPIKPATPVIATPDPAPVSPVAAQPLPIVPVYAPLKINSDAHRNREWLALSIAAHGTAAFDAWSTRRVLSAIPNAQEANPLLRPFAGNASMYAAVQVTPAVLDYLSRRMMNSRHAWMRHTWWVPQAVSAAVSLGSGVHNLGVYNAR
jgi:hypothetical protein